MCEIETYLVYVVTIPFEQDLLPRTNLEKNRYVNVYFISWNRQNKKWRKFQKRKTAYLKSFYSAISSNEIGRRGIIKGLISALKTDNPAIQSKTCEALSTYINSTESRSEVSFEPTCVTQIQ